MKAAPIRLVATDLDGTLLRDDGTVSEYTMKILRQVEAVVPIVLVTARPPRTAALIAREMGIAGPIVCCNGALVYDLQAERVLAHRPIAPEDARSLIRSIRSSIPGVTFAFELGTAYGHEPTYRPQDGHDGRPEDTELLIGDALELCVVPVTKLIVRHPTHPIPALVAAIQELSWERMIVTHSGAPFVEISLAGVDKASALIAIVAERGLQAADVLTFGDMPNDLPMLIWSGRGIAVRNAHPDVLAIVHDVTESNAEDGVARALERLILANAGRSARTSPASL